MRSLLIIGLGLGVFALSACGDSSNATLKGGACKADINCAGGQICVNAVCVAARGDAGNLPFGSGGSGVGAGGGTGTAGLTGGGGLGTTDGGPTGGGGLPSGGTVGGGGASGRASTDGGPGGALGTGGTPAGGVTCDTKTCRAGQTCCYTPADPRMPTSMATYTCTASLADGGSGCGAGDTAISCASTPECANNQKCCEVINPRVGISYSCLDQCGRNAPEVACSATSCGGTQVCCETVAGGGVTMAGLACADACAVGEYQLCTVDADCPAPGRGGVQTTCLFSRLSPLFKVCR